MKILGIETSCDETSAAVVEDGRVILSNIIASQLDAHQAFGGVVPELASRKHVELILPTVQAALDQAEVTLDDIDCIGAVNRPGLIGALIVGFAAAKTFALAASKPLVPVHHLEAHIYANWLTGQEISFPLVCLVVSGGHSDIVLMRDHGEYELLARTRDDAAGEAFDKCARAMGLGYPGGPIIDRLAKDGDPSAVAFPRANLGDSLDFSFSGLKTSVIRYAQKRDESVSIEDLAASFQQAVVDVLVTNTFQAAAENNVGLVMMAGGVAANSALQAALSRRGEETGIKVIYPRPILCTDNAAMVAAAAYFAYERGESAELDADCVASEPLGPRRA